jgi:hypothetical protein
MKTYTSHAKKLNITYSRCRYVLNQLELKPKQVTPNHYKSILSYQNQKHTVNYPFKKKVKIIEYFQNAKENNSQNIAKNLKVPMHRVDQVLNEYFNNNRCIIAESKMNKL